MRIPKLSYLLLSAVLLSVSCNKDSDIEQDNSQTDGTGTENPETGKPETDKADKVKAKQLYTDFYDASRDTGSEVSWTGNEPNCQPGTVPQNTMDKIFLRLAYFRKAIGLKHYCRKQREKRESPKNGTDDAY